MKKLIALFLSFLLPLNAYAQTYEVTTNNVGIGTWSVTNTLSVGGGLAVGSPTYTLVTAPTNGAIIQGNVGIGTVQVLSNLDVYDPTGNSLFNVGNNGYSALSVGNGGTVGIGTVSPNGTLAVDINLAGPANGAGMNIYGGPLNVTYSNVNIQNGSGLTNFQVTDQNNNPFLAVNGENLGGYVGIGTTAVYISPGYNNRLQVNGNAYFNSNVGIGSFQAGQKLDVQGTVRTTGFQLNESPLAGGNVLVSTSVGVGTWMPVSTLGAGGSGTVTSVGLSSPNSTLTIGSTPVTTSGTITGDINLTNANTWTGQQIFNTANVGIGSVHPGEQLDVTGTIRASSNILIGTQAVCQANGTNCPASSGTNYWSLVKAAGNVGISTTNTVGIGTTSGSAGLTVMNGNVGIGTWNPIKALQVIGSAQATALVTTGGTSSQFVKGDGSLDSTSYGTGTVTSVACGTGLSGGTFSTSGTCSITAPVTVALGGTNATSASITAFNNITGYTASGATGTTSTNLVFSTSPTLTTPTLGVATATSLTTTGNLGIGTSTITGGGLIVMNENVGIGSLTPGTSLDVQGTLRVSGHDTFEGVTSTGATGTGNLVFATSPTFTTPVLGTPTSGTMTNVSGTAASLTSGITDALASATTTVNVSSATAPSSGQVLTATGSTAATWQTPSGGGSNYWELGSGNIGIATYGAGNNVGIGTITANNQLVVGTTGQTTFSTSGNIGIGTNANQASLSVMNGNVGIGTYAPTAALQIVGQGFIYSSNTIGIGTNAPTGALEVEGNNVGIGTVPTNGALDVGVNSGYSGYAACIGTGNCLGACQGTVNATTGACGTCNCLTHR